MMAVKIEKEIVLRKESDTYNNLNRIESLDLLSGTGSIRIGKYWDRNHRDEAPSELLINREFATVELSPDELDTIKAMLYKHVVKLDKYKDGIKV
jgi:hypothetical protein